MKVNQTTGLVTVKTLIEKGRENIIYVGNTSKVLIKRHMNIQGENMKWNKKGKFDLSKYCGGADHNFFDKLKALLEVVVAN